MAFCTVVALSLQWFAILQSGNLAADHEILGIPAGLIAFLMLMSCLAFGGLMQALAENNRECFATALFFCSFMPLPLVGNPCVAPLLLLSYCQLRNARASRRSLVSALLLVAGAGGFLLTFKGAGPGHFWGPIQTMSDLLYILCKMTITLSLVSAGGYLAIRTSATRRVEKWLMQPLLRKAT